MTTENCGPVLSRVCLENRHGSCGGGLVKAKTKCQCLCHEKKLRGRPAATGRSWLSASSKNMDW